MARQPFNRDDPWADDPQCPFPTVVSCQATTRMGTCELTFVFPRLGADGVLIVTWSDADAARALPFCWWGLAPCGVVPVAQMGEVPLWVGLEVGTFAGLLADLASGISR